ncbi:E3 ubiquitin-protein ligase ATL42 [Prunus yedoensis var. nudiflora]|uniref:E3 ubiquitin-protein ligase ATL42 n=1 Tax=Prunus yedoensis var. nudiflora TaxID=2094558 RepID=A0A315AFS2_PRUYE|nr:E3 ubiquitin-protein ligase ATL42 [Prunus yedoensis var. nudiflora]
MLPRMIKILGQFQDFNLPMFHSSLIVLLLNCVVFHVEAQSLGSSTDTNEEQSSYQPGVHMVIGVLSIMFALTFTLLVYAKHCHREAPVYGNITREQDLSAQALDFQSACQNSKILKFSDCYPNANMLFTLAALITGWKSTQAVLCAGTSMRFLWNNQSEHRQDSNIELFVQREEEYRGSSRFSIGGSFRKSEKVVDKEEEMLIQEEAADETEEGQKILHKHKHKIVVSDFEFKNRWSNVSSSDLMFLNSEMLSTMSSSRFSSAHFTNVKFSTAETTGNEEIMKIREEMGMKRLFENKVITMNKNSSASNPILPSTSDSIATSADASSSMNPGEKRSMSEITALSRFGNLGFKNRSREPSLLENNVKEERRRRLWLPIARRTVQWFANREKRPQQPLDV